jgi:hypothetical protein
MKVEKQFQNGFESLEEAQLVQQFQVEELEKRYEMRAEWSFQSGDYTDGDGAVTSWYGAGVTF